MLIPGKESGGFRLWMTVRTTVIWSILGVWNTGQVKIVLANGKI
jgi:hypothetical protein